jgi:hypothetical protein
LKEKKENRSGKPLLCDPYMVDETQDIRDTGLARAYRICFSELQGDANPELVEQQDFKDAERCAAFWVFSVRTV